MSLDEVRFRPPRIETPRLVLRPWTREDADAVFAYASDPEVARYMFWSQHRSPEDSVAYLDALVARNYEREELDYALSLRSEPSRAIGGIGTFWRSLEHLVMELGYVLAREHWGNGYVPEAARALCAHAFASTPVERIYAPIFAVNHKSRRVAEKLGMHLDGVLRASLKIRGQRWDEAIYSLLRDDQPLSS